MPDDPRQKRLHDLEKRYDLLLEKLSRQQQALVLENRVTEQMQLERAIEADEAALQRVETELLSVRHQKRFAEANRLRRNQSYEKAIDIWREILLEEPAAAMAQREIAALEQLLAQKARVKDLRNRLLRDKQVREQIKPVFPEIGAVLNQQVDSAGHAELVEQLEDLMAGRLDPEGFLLWWEMEQSGGREQADVDIGRLAQRVQQGEIVLFLGSGIAALHTDGDSLESAQAKRLARQLGCEPFSGTLSSIAEYYRQRLGANSLLADLHSGLPQDGRDVLLYQALAKVQTPLVLISSTYDQALENTFRAAGKPFVELASIIQPNPGDGYDIGHVVVSYSDNSQPVRAYHQETLSGVNFLDQGYSVIYKIRGACEPAGGGDADEVQMMRQNTLTLAESSYFSFARHADKVVPAYIARQLHRRGLLFIGYRPRDWEDRLLVRALLDKRSHAQEPCYVIGASPEPLEQAFWKDCQVEQHQVDVSELDQYLGELVHE